MIEYHIRQKIVTEPRVVLPEGAVAVRVKHHDPFLVNVKHQLPKGKGEKPTVYVEPVEVPEVWQIIYLEPVTEEVNPNK